MPRFDIDQQRGAACLIGLLILLLEAVAYSLFQVEPNQLLTGASVSLAIGPVLTSTIERYRANREDRNETDDPPTPPKPPAEATEEGDDEELSEPEFRAKHGYRRECRAVVCPAWS